MLQLSDGKGASCLDRVPDLLRVGHPLLDRGTNCILQHILRLVSQTLKLIDCSPDGENFFNSTECAYTVRNVHVYNLVIAACYLTVDFYSVMQTAAARYVSVDFLKKS